MSVARGHESEGKPVALLAFAFVSVCERTSIAIDREIDSARELDEADGGTKLGVVSPMHAVTGELAMATGMPEAMTRAFLDRYGASLHAKSDQLGAVLTATALHGGRARHLGAVPLRADLEGVDRAPSVTEDAALATALAHLQGSCGAVRGTPALGTSELVVLANEETRYRLTFEVQSELSVARAVAPGGPDRTFLRRAVGSSRRREGRSRC